MKLDDKVRKDFIIKKNLCRKCATTLHATEDCTKVIACLVCKRGHTTVFHGLKLKKKVKAVKTVIEETIPEVKEVIEAKSSTVENVFNSLFSPPFHNFNYET